MMPATLTHDVEIIETTNGGGPPRDRVRKDDGGEGGRGPAGTPRRAYFTGLSLGIGAIVMFFMALVSAFIVRRGLGEDWQPFALPSILWLNTSVLLVSSITIELARRALHAETFPAFRRWWGLTLLLGVAFLFGQLIAWRDLVTQGVFLAQNPAASFFYLLTAAHGAHILGGLIALSYIGIRSNAYLARTKFLSPDLSAVYWHFMDGLWVFLLLLLTLGR